MHVDSIPSHRDLTRTLAGFFKVVNGRISGTDATLAGTVSNTVTPGQTTFTGPCPIGDGGANYTGT